MTTAVTIALALAIAAAAIWAYLRYFYVGSDFVRLSLYVSRTDAQSRPYPYVMVEADGAIRELYQSEREYLETPFVSYDGGRPFVKPRYGWRNALNDPSGFLARSKIPREMQAVAVVDRALAPGESRAEAIEQFRKYCGEIVEHEDGSISIPRPR